MGISDFEKFVNSQQEANADEKFVWDNMRDEWLANLDLLYQKVIDFLQEFVSTGSINYEFSNVMLTEEHLGTYSAKRMNIKIGRQQVSLEPIGTLLIACKGRVDAIGSAGRAQILLINEKANSPADLFKVTVTIGTGGKLPPPPPPAQTSQPISWTWKIVTNEARKRFVDLDKESLFAVLMEVANA